MREHRFAACAACLLAACQPETPAPETPGVPAGQIAASERLLGLEFTPSERALMAGDLAERREAYASLRAVDLPNDAPMPLVFEPYQAPEDSDRGPQWSATPALARPPDASGLAWLSVPQLGRLLREGEVTSVELTELALSRLSSAGVELGAVITLMRERALAQAREADAELAAGIDRGPLHGIPYGAKDLFAVPGYPTTWGAKPYASQVLTETATAIRKLDQAGAVLVAKLSLGALAWGDIWFGGQTKNPWDPTEGASGSSSGPAAAVAAGLVPFALGTETWGSVISPANRVGIIGFRPGYGRVSRHGVMTLAWSMDKVGVLCRHAEDCAMAFDAIRGEDPQDAASLGGGFAYEAGSSMDGLTVGYLESDFEADYPGADQDREFIERLRAAGMRLVPVELPQRPIQPLSFVLATEAAAAFDQFSRSGLDDQLVRQVREAWPNVLRAAHLVPAVDYLQANRVRYALVEDMESLFREVDLYLAPSVHGDNLLLTNLTGHPAVAIPVGFADPRSPTTITLVADYLDEGLLLGVAKQLQDRYGLGLNRPPGYE